MDSFDWILLITVPLRLVTNTNKDLYNNDYISIFYKDLYNKYIYFNNGVI